MILVGEGRGKDIILAATELGIALVVVTLEDQ